MKAADAYLDDLFGRPSGRLSAHMQAEIEHVTRVRAGGAAPLEAGEVVPGCNCQACRPQTSRPAPAPVAPGRIAKGTIQFARSVPILDVAEALRLEVEHVAGDEHATRCPLHDDTRPSLLLNERKDAAYCHVCGEGGDTVWLVRTVKRCSFPSAITFLQVLACKRKLAEAA